jgi:hypothetical protein
MPATYVKPPPVEPTPLVSFLKGRKVFELKDARVLKVEPNRSTGRIEITFETLHREALMLFPHRLARTVTSAAMQALTALPKDEARDQLLPPYADKRTMGDAVELLDFGLGDASIVAADAECIHVMIHCRSKPETFHAMFNGAEAARFIEMAMDGYNALTPKERAISDVHVVDPEFD